MSFLWIGSQPQKITTHDKSSFSNRAKETLLSLTEATRSLVTATRETVEAARLMGIAFSQQKQAIKASRASSREIAIGAKIHAEGAEALGAKSLETAAAAAFGEEASCKLVETMASLSRIHESMRILLKEMHQRARQTRILAVNAGIEASRLGASGSSFSVVAREVESLAEQSFDSLRETECWMEKASTAFEQARLDAQSTSTALEMIKNHTAEVAAVGEEIAAAVRLQQAEIVSLDQALQGIDSQAEESDRHLAASIAACEVINQQAVHNFAHVENLGGVLGVKVCDSMLLRLVEMIVLLSHFTHQLQLERGISIGYLGGKGRCFRMELLTQREQNHALWERIFQEVPLLLEECGDLRLTRRWESFRGFIELRLRIYGEIDDLTLTQAKCGTWYSDMIDALLDLTGLLYHYATTSRTARLIVSLVAFLRFKV